MAVKHFPLSLLTETSINLVTCCANSRTDPFPLFPPLQDLYLSFSLSLSLFSYFPLYKVAAFYPSVVRLFILCSLSLSLFPEGHFPPLSFSPAVIYFPPLFPPFHLFLIRFAIYPTLSHIGYRCSNRKIDFDAINVTEMNKYY
jgi:hypothetical protein